jgi:hypothetical protein
MFVASNINYYKFYSDIHNINTRHVIDLYQPSSSLSVFNNGIFNMSIKTRPVRMADNLTTFMCRLSRNLGASTSWNPQGLSRPVMGLLYLLHNLC